MKAIILAAGIGRRLAAAGWDMPKCLLPFGDTTLIDNMLKSLTDNGIEEAAIVVGYKKETVKKAASAHPLKLTFFENPDYENTNTINSLWRAAEFADDDIVYFNADILFDRRVVGLLARQRDSALAVDRKLCGQEEVKVILDDNDRVLRIGKAFNPADCAGEFTGIAVFRKGIWPDFKDALRYFNEDTGERNLFFEAAVDRICDKHVIRAVDVSRYTVIEIDTPEDLQAATKKVQFLDKRL